MSPVLVREALNFLEKMNTPEMKALLLEFQETVFNAMEQTHQGIIEIPVDRPEGPTRLGAIRQRLMEKTIKDSIEETVTQLQNSETFTNFCTRVTQLARSVQELNIEDITQTLAEEGLEPVAQIIELINTPEFLERIEQFTGEDLNPVHALQQFIDFVNDSGFFEKFEQLDHMFKEVNIQEVVERLADSGNLQLSQLLTELMEMAELGDVVNLLAAAAKNSPLFETVAQFGEMAQEAGLLDLIDKCADGTVALGADIEALAKTIRDSALFKVITQCADGEVNFGDIVNFLADGELGPLELITQFAVAIKESLPFEKMDQLSEQSFEVFNLLPQLVEGARRVVLPEAAAPMLGKIVQLKELFQRIDIKKVVERLADSQDAKLFELGKELTDIVGLVDTVTNLSTTVTNSLPFGQVIQLAKTVKDSGLLNLVDQCAKGTLNLGADIQKLAKTINAPLKMITQWANEEVNVEEMVNFFADGEVGPLRKITEFAEAIKASSVFEKMDQFSEDALAVIPDLEALFKDSPLVKQIDQFSEKIKALALSKVPTQLLDAKKTLERLAATENLELFELSTELADIVGCLDTITHLLETVRDSIPLEKMAALAKAAKDSGLLDIISHCAEGRLNLGEKITTLATSVRDSAPFKILTRIGEEDFSFGEIADLLANVGSLDNITGFAEALKESGFFEKVQQLGEHRLEALFTESTLSQQITQGAKRAQALELPQTIDQAAAFVEHFTLEQGISECAKRLLTTLDANSAQLGPALNSVEDLLSRKLPGTPTERERVCSMRTMDTLAKLFPVSAGLDHALKPTDTRPVGLRECADLFSKAVAALNHRRGPGGGHPLLRHVANLGN